LPQRKYLFTHFSDRKTLLQVSGKGEKTYQQAAGFLRVMDGDNPLDASAVHPESYAVVEKIAASCQRPVRSLIGDRQRRGKSEQRSSGPGGNKASAPRAAEKAPNGAFAAAIAKAKQKS
jgi:transcriptional accessory protein Tex/SPT6